MSRKLFDPNDCIGALNSIKTALQAREIPFSKECILKNLKGCRLPTNSNFWKVFRESGILQETSKGMYMFTSKEPIHVKDLTQIKQKYQAIIKKYQPETAKPVAKPVDDLSDKIEFAINFLKEQGYLVLAPSYILV